MTDREGRKQAVSIRLNAADLRNLRKLSRRLGVRNSEVIRYAIKSTLARLAPLHAGQTGKDLVPVLLDSGPELMRYLDLDVSRLEALVNEGGSGLRVEQADMQLLAMESLQQSASRLRRHFEDKYLYEPDRSDAEPRQSGGQL